MQCLSGSESLLLQLRAVEEDSVGLEAQNRALQVHTALHLFRMQLRVRVMRCDVQTALYDAKCVVLEREATLASQDKRVLWLETVAQDLQSEIRSLPSGGQY